VSATGTESRQLELLIACLGLAPVRRQYEESHGLCVRHAIRVTADGARAADQAATSMLGSPCSRGKVNERQRKYGWAHRHEEAVPSRTLGCADSSRSTGAYWSGGPPAAIRETQAPEQA